MPDAEKERPKHGPDPIPGALPTCLCGRTFWTWRAQGVHETSANRKSSLPSEGSQS